MKLESIKNAFREMRFGSNTVKYALIGLGGLLAILVVFQAGMIVGFKKASFAFKGGDNFYRAFGPETKAKFSAMIPQDDFVVSHGAVGKVVSVSLPRFIIQDQQRIEKEIVIRGDTVMRRLRGDATSTDLRLDDYVIVIGSPNDRAQVEAKMIRFVPPPGETF